MIEWMIGFTSVLNPITTRYTIHLHIYSLSIECNIWLIWLKLIDELLYHANVQFCTNIWNDGIHHTIFIAVKCKTIQIPWRLASQILYNILHKAQRFYLLLTDSFLNWLFIHFKLMQIVNYKHMRISLICTAYKQILTFNALIDRDSYPK